MKTICIVSGLLAMLGCLGCEKYEQPKAPEEVVLKSCTQVCEKDADCGTHTICVEGACINGCNADTDCSSDWITKKCNTNDPAKPFFLSKNTCYECLADSDCSGGLKCNAGYCTECVEDTDCKDATKGRCDLSGTCICAVDDNCTSAHMQLCRAEGCVCSDNSGCAGTAAETCYWGKCVKCAKDLDCTDGKVCQNPGTAGAKCVCKTDANCATLSACLNPNDDDGDGIINCQDPCPNWPFAGCIEELPDSDGDNYVDNYDRCPADKDNKCASHCKLGSNNANTCVECTDNAHCASNATRKICDKNACVECTKNDECTTPLGKCKSGKCVCSDDAACNKDGKKKCYPSGNCGCKDDADCVTGKLGGVCNPADGKCYCNTDSECTDDLTDTMKPACI